MSNYIILKKPSKVGKIVGFIKKTQVGKTGSPTLVPTLPIQEPWVPGYLISLAFAISSYCLRHLQGVQLQLSLLFITPFASLVFSSKTSPLEGVDGVFGSGF